MHNKTKQGRAPICQSMYVCVCLFVSVVQMSAIVSHSLEIAAEKHGKITKVEENVLN